jgi:hypothetical protein
MSDRPPMQDGDGSVDAELEGRLRAAFDGAAVPEAPAAVHAEAARLAATPDVRVRSRLGRWPAPGWIAVVLALSAILVGSLFTGGSSPAPTEPSRPAESAEASQPAPSSRTSAACDVSPGAIHGAWWREIGGPNAYFNWEREPVPAGTARWQMFVRFDPDAGSVDELSVWADRLGSEERAVGSFNSRADPSTIYRFDQQAPELPGGLYLFEQPLPTPGCWRLSAAIDDQVVGTAVIEVGAAVPPHPTPTSGPTPELERTPWPAESMEPAADDVLPLAGRDGLPGSLYCGKFMPFAFDALEAPMGAEDRFGPEFDVLRSSAGSDPDPGGDYGPDPTFREVARDANAVLFLYQQPADTIENFRYLYILVGRDGIDWRWAGSGDCTPRAVSPPGYGQATWTLDPAFRAPGGETRTLHILVNQLECSSGQSASGRISPAFVTWDERELLIEIFVQSIPGGGDCQGVPPTPATVRLPVPVGDRVLVDPATLDQSGTGG